MSRAPRHRGHRPPGLFRWEQGAPTDQYDEVPDNPKHRPCPACGAQRGEPCSRPSKKGGRQPLRPEPGNPLRLGFHPARAVIPPETAEPDTPVARHTFEPGWRNKPPADTEEPATETGRQRPSQGQEPATPPPTARAKADLKWAMNL